MWGLQPFLVGLLGRALQSNVAAAFLFSHAAPDAIGFAGCQSVLCTLLPDGAGSTNLFSVCCPTFSAGSALTFRMEEQFRV